MARNTKRREVGRPRIFSDEAFFAATGLAIREQGHTEFTLESIALEVGCTRQAILRRFGSKQGLLLAYLERTQRAIAENYRIDDTGDASPVEALRTRFMAEPDIRMEINEDQATQSRVLAFMLTASSDPKISPQFEAIHQTYLAEIERVLAAAIARGEIREVEPVMLARTLYSATIGETVLWASTPETRSHAARLGTIFDAIVNPYRVSASGLSFSSNPSGKRGFSESAESSLSCFATASMDDGSSTARRRLLRRRRNGSAAVRH